MLFNVEPGEKKQGCAGRRRGTVTLSVSEDGKVAMRVNVLWSWIALIIRQPVSREK